MLDAMPSKGGEEVARASKEGGARAEMRAADEGEIDLAVKKGLEGDAGWVGACVHVKVTLNPNP
jgi:hypothetical protein